MTAKPKQDSSSLATFAPKVRATSQTSLKMARYHELDAEFARQSKLLTRMVNRLKHELTRKIGWGIPS